MASSQQIPSSGTFIGTGDSPFSNWANVYDGSDATYAAGSTFIGFTWKNGSVYNFGFSIPSGATIDGFEVIVRCRDATAGNTLQVWLTTNGTAAGSESTNSYYCAPGAAAEDVTLGSSADMWGETYDRDDINATNFGVVIDNLSAGSNHGVRVYAVDIVCYYTESGGDIPGSSRIVHHIEPEASKQSRIVHHIEQEASKEDRLSHIVDLVQAASDRIVHTIEGDKHVRAGLAHDLELVFAVSPNKFPPDTDEGTDTAGNWLKSTGSDFYPLVDELDEVSDFMSRADYAYIAEADIVTGTSQLILSCQSVANADQDQPGHRRLAIRGSCEKTASTGSVTVVGILIYNSTTYVHSTPIETALAGTAHNDIEFIWDTPPWGGSDWYAPQDIKFGLRITAEGITSGDFRINQLYLNYLGTNNSSELVKTFYPTEHYLSSGMTEDFGGGTAKSLRWRDLRADDSGDVYTITPGSGDYVRERSIEGSADGYREFYGPAVGYVVTVKADMRIVGSTSVTVRGDIDLGGILSSDTQVITATSNTTFSFVINNLPASSALGDPDDFFFGLYITSVDGTPEWYINQLWLEVTGEYVIARLAHDIVGEKIAYGRMGQTLDMPAAPATDWWDTNFLKRRLLTYGTSHDELPADHTMKFEIQTGYEQRIATNAASDDALQHMWYAVDTSGSPDQPYTYAAWQSADVPGTFNVALRRYSHFSGTWGTEIDLGPTGTTPDGHFSPKVCVDGDGYVWVFYGSHGSEQFYRKSTVPWSIEGGFGAKTSLGASDAITYPRPAVDSSGNIWLQGRGYSGTPPIGAITTEFAGYYKYTLSTDTWSSWNVVVDYGTTSADRELPGELGSVYSGGFEIDDNDRIHWIVVWWEGYLGTPNAGRAVSYIYSDDGIDWYQYNAANPSGEQVGSLTYPVRYVSHDGFSGITAIVLRTHILNGPWPINNTEALSIDINGYPYFAVPWVDPNIWNNTFGPADMYIGIWNGTDWTVTDLTTETTAPQNRGFGSCESIVVDNSSASIYVYAMVEPPAGSGEFASSEIYRWRGASWGTTWVGQLLTGNTALGLAATHSTNKQYTLREREILTNRGRGIYWGEDVNYPFINPTGDDVRIVRQHYNNLTDTWSGTDLHRLPDRFRALDTELNFAAGVIVPEDQNHPHTYTRMYTYYSYPNNAAAALNDPNEVWRYFEGFEDYTTGTGLVGQGGWTEYGGPITMDIAHTYRTDLFANSKWDKVAGGFASVSMDIDTHAGGPYGAAQAMTLDGDEITIWASMRGGSSSDEYIEGIELYDSVSGDWIRLGRVWNDGNNYRAGYWQSDDATTTTTAVGWQTNTSFPEWHKITIQISSSGVSFWLNDNLVVSNNTQITSADSLRIMGNRPVATYFDQLTIKSFTANDATITAAAEEGDANIPVPYPAIVHTADIAFFRSGRIAQALELAQSDSDRLVHHIVGSKPAQDRIAEWLELEAHVAGQLVHDLELTKSGKSRLFHWLEAEAADQSRIVHSLVLAFNKSSRLAHDLELEADDLDQIVHEIVGDKHLSDRLVHHIVGAKPAQSRLAHDIEAEAAKQSALVHFAELDKHDVDRLVHAIVAEASLASRLAHNLELTKSGKAILAHILVGEKHIAARIAHSLEFEVSPEGRITHILEMLAHKSARIAHALVAEKPDSGRISQYLTGEKPASDRIVQWAEMEAADQAQIVHDIELVVAASGRMTHKLETIANRAARIVQILDLEAADEDRLVHTLELVQGGAARVAQILVNDKHFSDRLVHELVFEATGAERLMHTLELTKLMSSRLAHSLVGDKHVRTAIVQTIVAEAAKQARIVQEIVGDKNMSDRLAQWLETDKNAASRLIHTIDFIGAVIGFKFTDSDWGTIKMLSESMSKITFASESMVQTVFNSESMTPAVSWSGESMAQITFANETMVPNC